MKSFITAMIVAAVLVAGSIAFNFTISSLSDKLLSDCGVITQLIENEDFDAASRKTNELAQLVKSKKTMLASVINHQTIDDIEVCIAELERSVQTASLSQSLIRCGRLDFLISHLPENYTISLQNIL